MVNTLDILSGGRAYLGIGAAWYEDEAKGYGIPYPSTSERFEYLEAQYCPDRATVIAHLTNNCLFW